MSFNICRGTLGSLAMFTAIRNVSSRVSSFALERRPGSFSGDGVSAVRYNDIGFEEKKHEQCSLLWQFE